MVNRLRSNREIAPEAARAAEMLKDAGDIRYGAIARNNPALKHEIDDAVRARIAANPDLSECLVRYKSAVAEGADLKGLSGRERGAHEAASMDDLQARLGNAQIKAIVAAQKLKPTQQAGSTAQKSEGALPDPDPLPIERRREQAIAQEIESCLPKKDREALGQSADEQDRRWREARRKLSDLPVMKYLSKQAPANPRQTKDARRWRLGLVSEAWSKLARKRSESREGTEANARRRSDPIRDLASCILERLRPAQAANPEARAQEQTVKNKLGK